jgi:DUF1365 family protein
VKPRARTPSLYEGVVTHTRRTPLVNRFRYRAGYWLVDYDRLPQPTRWMGAVARVRRDDHADVRSLLSERGLVADQILVLATGRTLGYVFNPISIFWCYDDAGEPTAVLAEVHNTYGGSHVYVLDGEAGAETEIDKELYVSPFYSTEGSYRIRVSPPGPTVSVSVTLEQPGHEPFVATLAATRRPLSVANVLRVSLRYPALRTSALIRWQALRLWIRGLKVVPR